MRGNSTFIGHKFVTTSEAINARKPTRASSRCGVVGFQRSTGTRTMSSAATPPALNSTRWPNVPDPAGKVIPPERTFVRTSGVGGTIGIMSGITVGSHTVAALGLASLVATVA